MSENPKHWGEFEDDYDNTNNVDDSVIANVMADIERSMDKFCLAEYDVEPDDSNANEETVTLEPMDPRMLYAITLHKHLNDMNDMIRVAELAIESRLIPPPDAAAPVPEMPPITMKHTRNSLNFIPKEFTPFTEGEEIEVPELSFAIVKQILSKCIATMLAHIGYETTHQSILDLLTDVLIEFYKKISNNLRIAAEDEMNGQMPGFPNPIERVLVEIGFGGVSGLHDYYQSRIIKYNQVLQNRCHNVNKRYNLLLKNSTDVSELKTEANIIKVKEECDDAIDVDNSQLHLALDGDLSFSSLDAGFQLLSSLEAGASSQSLSQHDEDSSITISPSVNISESDLPSVLPYAKRKRTK